MSLAHIALSLGNTYLNRMTRFAAFGSRPSRVFEGSITHLFSMPHQLRGGSNVDHQC